MSYANVAATMALVFSMAGGAAAAKHYLITSPKQISPKVLRKLRAHNGKNGATGATGSVGPTGAAGAVGAPGAEGRQGPAGPAIEWALVAGNGESIIEQSGGITIASHPGAGAYYLSFPSTVAGHAISALTADSSFPAAAISASPCGGGSGAPPDSITCLASGTNDTHHMFVATVNKEATEENKTFYIEVFQ